LYDYGRPRELHIKEGLAATKLNTNAGKVIRERDAHNVLVRSPFFEVEKMQLRDDLQAELTGDSPHIIVAINGAGIMESEGMEPITFATGDAVVIPACVHEYRVHPQWELELMRMSLPVAPIEEPLTELPRSVNVE
jgi:mannose-6-phosphate isomerase